MGPHSPFSRPAPLAHRAGALALGLALGTLLAPSQASAQTTPVEVARGVFVLTGSMNEASPENVAEVGNTGFIVGDTGTIVINTGGSYRHGRRILETAERIGGKPVVLAVITQPLQEFIMGNGAFAERGIPLLAHEAAARLIADRCETCLHNLNALLGEQVMAGTRVVVPDRTLIETSSIVEGGREIHLLHFGHGSVPGDLAVLDPASGVLFAGSLVSIGRIPEMRDADRAGWITALTRLSEQSFRVLVPGYGPPGTRADVPPMQRYLESITEIVGDRLRKGTSLYDAVRTTELPAFEHWALYGVIHRRNVQTVYLQLEIAEFER